MIDSKDKININRQEINIAYYNNKLIMNFVNKYKELYINMNNKTFH